MLQAISFINKRNKLSLNEVIVVQGNRIVDYYALRYEYTTLAEIRDPYDFQRALLFLLTYLYDLHTNLRLANCDIKPKNTFLNVGGEIKDRFISTDIDHAIPLYDTDDKAIYTGVYATEGYCSNKKKIKWTYKELLEEDWHQFKVTINEMVRIIGHNRLTDLTKKVVDKMNSGQFKTV